MKALTLWEPWATLVALRLKKFETRGWSTEHRGPLAIHASAVKRWEGRALHEWIWENAEPLAVAAAYPKHFNELAFGKVVAIADLTDCTRMATLSNPNFYEKAFGDWKPKRFAWSLEGVVRLRHPIAAKGKQGLWNFVTTEELR